MANYPLIICYPFSSGALHLGAFCLSNDRPTGHSKKGKERQPGRRRGGKKEWQKKYKEGVEKTKLKSGQGLISFTYPVVLL